VQTVQIIYNIFRQRPAELFFRQAEQRKVGILARVPLASGLLTGKMTHSSSFEAEDHRAFNRHGEAFDRGETFAGVDYETGLAAVDALRPLVPAGMSMPQFALRWILMDPAVTCAIPGAKRAAQAADNLAAADLPPFTPETMAQVKAVYDRMVKPLVHHYW
jgi:aryl-alcohol dehydrogenase-like predicted oxidoreductase